MASTHKIIVCRPEIYRPGLKRVRQSAKPEDKKYSAYDQAEILTAFINELGLDPPVLVGHSFGGIVSGTFLNGAGIIIGSGAMKCLNNADNTISQFSP
jgi:hypothetical protein